jgi:hypothetical protein
MSSFLSQFCIVSVSRFNDLLIEIGSFYPNLAVVFSLENVLGNGQNVLDYSLKC